MNGRERVVAAIRGEAFDQRPVILHGFMPAVADAGIGYQRYRADSRAAAEAHIRFVEKYGLDGVEFDVDTAVLASAVGAPVDYPETEAARVEAPLLESLEDLSPLDGVKVVEHPRIQHSLEAAAAIKEHFGDDVFVRGHCDQGPFSLACALRSPEEFMMDLLVDPEGALALLERCAEFSLEFVRAQAATGVDGVTVGDSPAGPSMISPQMYDRFAKPFEQMVVEEARRVGLYSVVHICGDTSLILQPLASLGADVLELDYKTPSALIREVLGDSVTACGTVDPSSVIALGTPDTVQAATRELLACCEENPRLILNAGCAIPPMAPEANIRALVQCVRE
jgi:uroporphyrinogen decarboxylase